MKPPKGTNLISADYFEDYKFVFKFSNGKVSTVDFKPIITYGKSLLDYLDISKFKKIQIDKERGDIYWGKNWDMCFHIEAYYNEVEIGPILESAPRRWIPLKSIVNEFTSQTFGREIPVGLCFSTCLPLSILLDSKQIKNSISCGDAPKNNGSVTHFWLTLDNRGTILDPTIRQFDPKMESTFVGKLTENEVTKNYILDEKSFQEYFGTSYNTWKEPLIDKQPRTFHRAPGFELKMNLFNIKSATILYRYIEKMPSKDQFILQNKCVYYFSPIFHFHKDKSKTDKNLIEFLIETMPKDFKLLLLRALNWKH